MIKLKDLTIIIPHLGGTRETEYALDQCLESLHGTVPSVDVIVVSNGLRCEREDHQVLSPIKINYQGQCKAVNAAAATVNTPWIFVTNDDMIYPPGWWERLTQLIFSDDNQIQCVSPQLVEPRQGAPTFIQYFCGGAGGDFDKQKWLDFAKNHKQIDFPHRTGFNLPFLIKKELWDTVGGYDVNYDPWGSNGDSDLEYKIKLAGVQPYQNTNCIVYHFSQTSGTFHPDNHFYWQKNFAYFKEKWGFDRTDERIWEATFEIPGMPERTFWPDWENKYGS